MRKGVLAATVLFVILAISEIPVYAFVIGPNPSADDNVYEMYGPHVKGLNVIVYSDTTAEWNAMQANLLDLEDWALDIPHIILWSNNANGMVEANYGGEAGYYLLDVNNNATYAASDAGPFVHNPTSELPLRQALAYIANRTDIVQFTGGLALPMYTVIPTYMAGYVNHNIDPAGSLAALSYDTLARGGDPAAAIALLDANGYTTDGNGSRIDPVSQGGTGAELNLIFYSRGGDRGTFGDHYNTILNNVLKIKTIYYSHVPRSTVTGPVFAQEYFNLYTGCWTGIGPDPDFMDDLYDGSNFYHLGSPSNYDGIDYADLNGNLTTIKLAGSIAQATAAVLDAQIRFAEHAAAVPLFCYAGVKDYKNLAVANGGQWKDLVNQKGVGVNSWWSTLSMKQVDNLYPNAYAYYGFSSTVTLQNMIYAQGYWDQEVLGRIYDGGARRDPHTLASFVPQLYKSWTVGTWKDPVSGENKTSVTITLRPDVYWQDGQPFTVADVYYTLVEMSKDLLAKGFPPPWWYPTVQYMRSVEIIDDYNIQILLDVQSVWAVGWVIRSVVIPIHIWKPIVAASTVGSTKSSNVDATTPDSNIIGTGPFKWYSGIGSASGQTIVLVANNPGAQDMYANTTSPGYYFYNPIYVDVSPDNNLNKINISPTAPSVVSNITITLRNMDTHDSLTVNKYVYVNGVLQGGFPHDVTLLPLAVWNSSNPYPADASGHADVETLTLTLAKATLTFVKVAVQVKGPSTVGDPQANPWISTWVNVTMPIWVTIIEDIGGTDLFTVLGYTSYSAWLKNYAPAPDLKVDGRDINMCNASMFTVPGDPRWNVVADVNHDYRIDPKDIALIIRYFGWPSYIFPELAVTSVGVSKNVICLGYSADINVTVANTGNVDEISNMTIYGNTTIIGTLLDVSFAKGTSTSLVFTWNTTGFAKGNYTMSAVVDAVEGESNTTNNNFTDGWVFVSIVGDLTGGTPSPWDFVPDGKVDGKDIAIVALCYGSAPGCPPPYIWNANCDVNGDGKVDGKDIATVALHYGEANP